jgi:hypothetical protein
MRFHDGCHRLRIIGPLEVRESRGRGIRITAADDIELSDIHTHHNSIEGIITGDCLRGQYLDIAVEDSRSSPNSSVAREYPPDKRHGIYISGNADDSVVKGLSVRRVTGSGLQANGAGMEAIIRGLTASELEFVHVGSGGTPPLSLMAVQDSTIERFCEDWTAGDRWAVLFADGHGSSYACRNVTFREYTVPRGTHAAEEEGSGGNHFLPGAGWSPGEPTEPTEPAPEPQPEPDIAAALAAIEEADADIEAAAAMLTTATAQLATARTALGAASG